MSKTIYVRLSIQNNAQLFIIHRQSVSLNKLYEKHELFIKSRKYVQYMESYS